MLQSPCSESKDSVGKILANTIINDLKGQLKKRGYTIETCPVAPEAIGFLARRVHDGTLTKKQMKETLIKWLDESE